MDFVSIRIRKNKLLKGTKSNGKYYKSLKEQLQHDFRKEEMDKGYLQNPNNKNYLLYKKYPLSVKNIQKSIDNFKNLYKTTKKRNLPKNTKEILTGVITFSASFKDVYFKNPDLFNNLVNNFLKQKFGESYLYAVAHTDETTPHFHFSLLNYNFKTNTTIGRNLNTSELQDEIGAVFSPYGFNRGIKKEKTKSQHLGVLEGKKIQILKNIEEIKEEYLETEKNHEKILKNIQIYAKRILLNNGLTQEKLAQYAKYIQKAQNKLNQKNTNTKNLNNVISNINSIMEI